MHTTNRHSESTSESLTTYTALDRTPHAKRQRLMQYMNMQSQCTVQRWRRLRGKTSWRELTVLLMDSQRENQTPACTTSKPDHILRTTQILLGRDRRPPPELLTSPKNTMGSDRSGSSSSSTAWSCPAGSESGRAATRVRFAARGVSWAGTGRSVSASSWTGPACCLAALLFSRRSLLSSLNLYPRMSGTVKF